MLECQIATRVYAAQNFKKIETTEFPIESLRES